MALHRTPSSMLKESLDESLEAAKLCINYKKTDSKWGDYATGGCLGFPAAVLLFSIIDSIGSYYRKNTDFKITIDGKSSSINAEGWEHFKILNSKYFKRSLSLHFIKALYQGFRSKLTHNSVLGRNTQMFPGQINDLYMDNISYQSKGFATSKNEKNETIYLVSLSELLIYCESAVALFKTDIDTIVPLSKQGHKFH
jgi:hypothetical protein